MKGYAFYGKINWGKKFKTFRTTWRLSHNSTPLSLEGFRWVGVVGYERFNSMSQFPICGTQQYKYGLTQLYWR